MGEVRGGYLQDLELSWIIFKAENWLRLGRTCDIIALDWWPSELSMQVILELIYLSWFAVLFFRSKQAILLLFRISLPR